MNKPEQIVLLNDVHEPIGVAPKLETHHANTPLHLAFSCYIFNDKGEVLVTQRAHGKKVWPGVWTNSVCGHPAPGESFESAIERRVSDEIGAKVTGITCVLPEYRYITPPYNGIVENEFCPVFAADIASELRLNPDEVADSQWLKLAKVRSLIAENPDIWSYWVKDALKQLGQLPDPRFADR